MKKKLVLDLDAIVVTSFEAGGGMPDRGTVHARASGNSCAGPCPDSIMQPSCEISCLDSCLDPCTGHEFTCGMSCLEGCPSVQPSCTC